MKIEISKTKKKKTTEKSTEKKITFSKFLAIFSCVLVVISLIDLLVINSKLLSGELITYDFTAFVYLIPSSFGLCAATFAFYYNKSKLENAIKIRYSYVTKLLELKKSMELYSKEELQYQIDNYINEAENGSDNQLSNAENSAADEINVNV